MGTFTDALMILVSAGRSVHCFVLLAAQTGILLVAITFLSPTGDGFLVSSVFVLGDSEF